MKGFWSNKTPTEKIVEGAMRGRGGTGGDPCARCGLDKKAITPRIPVSGNGRLGILGIGEGPGKNEDEQGYNFAGEAGTLWEGKLQPYGITLHEDLWLTNAVNCRPPGNRTPKPVEIEMCRGRVLNAINTYNPKFIWLVGESAVRSFYGGRFRELGIGRWHRLCIPDKNTGAWVVPMYHPSFALRASKDLNKMSQYDRDLKFAVSCLNLDPPTFRNPEDYISIITDYDQLVQYLNWVLQTADQHQFNIAFDYETSNTKPFYGAVQHIWSCAISTAEDACVAFPVSYTGHFTWEQINEIKRLLVCIMGHPNIGKIAHNLQFEDLWTRGVLECDVNNWHWCTMNAAHVLDCRSFFTGLKFQAYINFGVEGYEKELAPFMRKYHAGVPINMLDTVPLEKLLVYNGIDALITMWLYQKQHPILTSPYDMRSNGYALMHGGLQALNDASFLGINMEQFYYLEQADSLKRQWEELQRKLTRGKPAKEFMQLTGRELTLVNSDFSAGDLRVMLYDVLKVPSKKQTASGLKSVDKEVVESIQTPWTKALVDFRRVHKLLNTYLAQFIREITSDGRMHPNFPLHIPRTYRGSSRGPNFQNIPNREEEAKAVTRKGIIPSSGRRILAIDYGSQEVRGAAILSQDPILMWYCSQDDSDMHMDTATRLWALPMEEVPKIVRFHSKGGFVFAEIYGSYYVNCGVELWEQVIIGNLKTNSSKPIKQHLKEVGIISGPDNAKTKMKLRGKLQTVPKHMAQYVDHVKSVEGWFWETFAALRDWQYRMVDTYQKKGYVEMPFGFRRTDMLTNNQIFNTAIQGTAFHLLLWSYIVMNEYCKTRWRTDMLGQIHDEMLFDLIPPELQEIVDTAVWVMTQYVVEHHPWVNVPLVAEPQLTQVDESWYYKKDIVRHPDTGIWEYKHVLKEQGVMV